MLPPFCAAGLGSLRELNLCGNCISTLEPLSGLSQLQALDVSHNRLSSLQGVQVSS